jgi:hypothetical protein
MVVQICILHNCHEFYALESHASYSLFVLEFRSGSDNALAHMLEINQIVSAQNTIKLLDLNCSGFLQPKLYRFARDLELCSRCGIRVYSLGVNCLMCIMLSLKSH